MTPYERVAALEKLVNLKERRVDSAARAVAVAQAELAEVDTAIRDTQNALDQWKVSLAEERSWFPRNAASFSGRNPDMVAIRIEHCQTRIEDCVLELEYLNIQREDAAAAVTAAARILMKAQAQCDGAKEQYKIAQKDLLAYQETMEQFDVDDIVTHRYGRDPRKVMQL